MKRWPIGGSRVRLSKCGLDSFSGVLTPKAMTHARGGVGTVLPRCFWRGPGRVLVRFECFGGTFNLSADEIEPAGRPR